MMVWGGISSLLGPLGMPLAWLGIAFTFFVLYALLHGVQLAKFYGMRAVHLRGDTSGGPISLGLNTDRSGTPHTTN